jgi:hypothetical protein
MAKRKKLWKIAMVAKTQGIPNKEDVIAEKVIQTVKEVFENVVESEPIIEKVDPIVEEVVEPEPVVEEAAVKPKPKARTKRKPVRTKKDTGV